MTKLSFDAVHYAGTVEQLRGKEVAAENARTPFGRETLCGLFSGAMTKGDLIAALIAALKPKKPSGKPGDNLSSLRYAKGGDAIRKAAELCLEIHEASAEGRIADVLRPRAIAFAVDAPDAPKTLYALRDEMKAFRAAAAKADKAEGGADEGEGENEGENEGEDKAPAPVALSVMAERLALAVREASVEDINAADGPLADLLTAIRDAYAKAAEVETARTGTEG